MSEEIIKAIDKLIAAAELNGASPEAYDRGGCSEEDMDNAAIGLIEAKAELYLLLEI